MRVRRNLLSYVMVAMIAVVLHVGTASAQTGTGSPSSGEIPTPPPGCVMQSPTEGTETTASLLVGTSFRMLLSRWFSFPVSPTRISVRHLLHTGR